MTEQTIQILQQTLASNPEDFALRCHLAELLNSTNREAEVPALFLAELQRPWPQDEPSTLKVAQLIAQGEPQAALMLLDEWLAQDKACAPAYLQKAEIFRAQGNFEQAKKNYGVATVIDESLQSQAWDNWIESPNNSSTPSASSPPPASAPAQQSNPPASFPPQSATPNPDRAETQPPASQPPALPPAQSPQQQQSPSPDFGTDFESEFEEDFEGQSEQLEQLFAAENQIDFSQVGGMDAVKERVRMSIIYPFQNKELFAKFKKRTGGGILFYGPPGCGKTLISRATAGECGANFIEVSIFDILSRWIGEAESRLHSIFETARRKAPSIIFIDEVDALGVKRSDAGNSASVVNTLLTEIDGASSKNDDLLIIGATNTPWRVDSAFRRPGRFDHVLFVPPPDAPARESIFRLALDGVPQESLNFAALAKASEKFSGADIRAVVERATEETLQEMMKTGKEAKLTNKQLTKALKKHRPTTLEWLEQATNYASYANQSGLYDELSEYLQGNTK